MSLSYTAGTESDLHSKYSMEMEIWRVIQKAGDPYILLLFWNGKKSMIDSRFDDIKILTMS